MVLGTKFLKIPYSLSLLLRVDMHKLPQRSKSGDFYIFILSSKKSRLRCLPSTNNFPGILAAKWKNCVLKRKTPKKWSILRS